jgi:hypothetical protein
MVASPTVIQQVQASAASDPHVNCFKMVTDGADPVMYVYPSAACRDPPPLPTFAELSGEHSLFAASFRGVQAQQLLAHHGRAPSGLAMQ